MLRTCSVLAVCLLPAVNACGGDPVDYATNIKPLLKARCYACHGALKQESGLRLDTGHLIRQGGEGGPVVKAGKADSSVLLQRVQADDESERMPPEGERLSATEISLLRNWIEQGASSPPDEQPEPDPRAHWAFRKPQRPQVPVPTDADWVRNPIDAFIAARHEAHGVAPLPAAHPEVLLRRLYLDLIGLPPTRTELHSFRKSFGDQEYAAVVDNLLDRPQYGERWGRHWMDVWRYSDWYGRRNVNDVRNSYPHIWRWRDWIIRSLNEDRGYDRMIMEMLAADEIAPTDDQAIAATGFIVRNWFSLNYDQWKRDLVEHTGKAFLGLRLNCALCHDHKYDPITQEEYFRFRAFFEPLEFRHDRVPGGPRLTKYLRYRPGSGAALKPIEAGLARVYEEELDAPTRMYRLGDQRDLMEDVPPVTAGVPAVLTADPVEVQPVELPPVAWYPGLKSFIQQAELAKHQQAVDAAQSAVDQAAPNTPAAAVAAAKLKNAELQREAVQARIQADNVRYRGIAGDPVKLARQAREAEWLAGQATAELELATAEAAASAAREKLESPNTTSDELTKAEQTVAAANKKLEMARQPLEPDDTAYTPLSPQYRTTSTGRRSALARWIANNQNPLTARVAVNHIWMRHFGRPLVESVNDLGRSGEAPTHPQLLDWLAVEFMESGWSMKHIHRLIVSSNTYRMRSGIRDLDHPNLARDRDNRFWWRFERRRMEGELVRDSLLHVAGQLDMTIGGPEIANDKGMSVPRRSLYFCRYPEHGGTMPFLELFDPPDPTDCYRRSESVVPQQALALSNSELTLHYGRRLAARLSQQLNQPAQDAFVEAAFECILSRRPSGDELQRCIVFLDTQSSLYESAPQQSASTASKLVQPASLDTTTRARESLIRVLFNHPDFVTIH